MRPAALTPAELFDTLTLDARGRALAERFAALGLPGNKTQITMTLSSPAPAPLSFTIDNPARIAFDHLGARGIGAVFVEKGADGLSYGTPEELLNSPLPLLHAQQLEPRVQGAAGDSQ